MTVSSADRQLVGCHELLLRLAGHLPDGVLCSVRDMLAEGQVVAVGRAVLAELLDGDLTIGPADAQLLAEMLPDVPSAIIAERVDAAHDSALLDFSPVPPVGSGPGAAPLLLDLTGSVTPGLDAIDAAVVATVGELSSAVAVWRAWRLAQVDRFGDGPVRVYVVETRGEPLTLPSLTALLQDVLSRAGVRDPQVETYGPGTFLPRYLRQARGRAALIWAARPRVPATIARVFDSYDPATGGRFDNDHPLLSDGDDRAGVLRYLEQGRILLHTTGTEADVFGPQSATVVPMCFRTDGRWIWTDAVRYYLATYALSPEPALVSHIRARGYVFVEPDAVAEHRAMAVLAAP